MFDYEDIMKLIMHELRSDFFELFDKCENNEVNRYIISLLLKHTDIDLTSRGWYRRNGALLKINELVYNIIINSKVEIDRLKKIYNGFETNVLNKLDDIIDASWDRVVDAAREEMFDDIEEEGWNGEKYYDTDEIGDQELFDYYHKTKGRGFFLNWVRQDFAHNVENNSIFKMFIGRTSDIDWNKINRQIYSEDMLIDYIYDEINGEVRYKAEEIFNLILNTINKCKNELNMPENKYGIYHLIFNKGTNIKWVKAK